MKFYPALVNQNLKLVNCLVLDSFSISSLARRGTVAGWEFSLFISIPDASPGTVCVDLIWMSSIARPLSVLPGLALSSQCSIPKIFVTVYRCIEFISIKASTRRCALSYGTPTARNSSQDSSTALAEFRDNSPISLQSHRQKPLRFPYVNTENSIH